MDPEVKKALDALRADIGKNLEAAVRLDAIEKAAQKGDADTKVMRAELDKVKADVITRENEIKDLQQKNRVQLQAADPIRERSDAIAMFGRVCRANLCRALNLAIPEHFKDEVQIVRAWNDECIARATITPMSTTGSYLVPTAMIQTLIDTLEEVSPMLGIVDFIPGLPAGGTIQIPSLTARPSMKEARAGTDTAMTASDPTFGLTELTPKETYIYFPIDNKFMQMSPFDLGSICMNLLRDGMADKLGYWLLYADGTSTYNSTTGILKDTTAAYIYNLPTGKKAFSDLAAADLTKIMSNCLKRGRARGIWLMSLDVQGLIEDMDRQGKLPLIRERDDGTIRLKQREVIVEEYMPDLSESDKATPFLGFGDPKTFILGQCGGMQFASDTSYLFGKNQTAFRATTIVDIKRKPVKTFTVAKTAAE